VNALASLPNTIVLAAEQSGGLTGLILPAVLMIGLAYMFIVPQRKQKQKAAEFMSKLEVGSEVVTAGGLYGTINHIEGDVVHLEVDTDVVIRISKGSLARFETPPVEEAQDAAKPGLAAQLGFGKRAQPPAEPADGKSDS